MTISNEAELADALLTAGHTEFTNSILGGACVIAEYSDGRKLFQIELCCTVWTITAKEVDDTWDIQNMHCATAT